MRNPLDVKTPMFKDVKALVPVRNKQLASYLKVLGKSQDRVIFDDKALEIILDPEICRNKKLVDYVRETANRLDYAQSRKDAQQIVKGIERFSHVHVRDKSLDPVVSRAIDEISAEFPSSILKPLCYQTDDDIKTAVPKLSTHAGLLGVLSGKPKKYMHMDGIFNRYCRYLKEGTKKGYLGRDVVVSYRTQNSSLFDVDGNLKSEDKLPPASKTRTVMMMCLLFIILERRWQLPFQNLIEGYDWYAGGKEYGQLSEIVARLSRYEDWQGRPHWLVIDYSAYDQTIPGWLIRSVFQRIIKPRFVMNGNDERMFDMMVEAIIRKNIWSPDGRLIHADDGNPSGSMWTQIIGTLCNYVMIRAYMISRKINCKGMTIMGDDNLISTKQRINRSDLSRYLETMFGVEVNPKKCSDDSEMKYPEFLSTVWKPQGRWRSPQTLLLKLMFPERRRDYPSGKCDPTGVVLSYILAYPEGMKEIINVEAFLDKYSLKAAKWLALELKEGKYKERLLYKTLLSRTEVQQFDPDDLSKRIVLEVKNRTGAAA